MLISCFRYLSEKNIKVPYEVTVITFDDYDFVSAMNPPVTTLQRIDLKIGRKAAKLLMSRINGNVDVYKEVRIGEYLIIRKSCGCK